MTLRYTLPNGLKVVFDEQHASRVAAFQVWVKVGSADETPSQIGLAHLHEHMLFKGTRKRALGEIAHDIEAHGGEINAWTSFDQTVYHIVIARPYARHGLEVLADAIQNSVFEPTELSKEIEVVCEEIKRTLDTPGRRASRELFAAAYRVHPYQRPVIGFEESVRAFTRDQVLGFYGQHYTPDNMVLAVAGDLHPDEVKAWVDELFGDFPASPRPRLPRPTEPPFTGRRVVLKQDSVKEAWLNLAFQIPHALHDDTPALDLLAMAAGQGEASRLVLEVKRKKALVNDIHAYAYTPQDSGLWVTSLQSPPGHLPSAMEETLRVLSQLKALPVADDELATLKALVESEAIYQRETVQGVARKLGYYEAALGSVEEEARYYEKVAAVTPQDIQRVAQAYLDFDRLVVSALLPPGTAWSEEDVHRCLDRIREETPREASLRKAPPLRPTPLRVQGHAHASTRARTVVQTLSSGAKVVVRPETAVPLFAMRAVFPGGLRYETPADNGLTTLLSRLWTRGTARHEAEEISHLVDALAGTLSGMGGRNSLSLRGEFLSRHFERAFDLFSDCLLCPRFPDSEFERERNLLLQDIHTREDKPSSVAIELFNHTLFQTHPYRMSTLGEDASVRALTPAALATYHAQSLDPSQLTFCVVGDVDIDEVLRQAEKAFGKTRGQARPPPNVPAEVFSQSPRKAHKKLDTAQSHLVLGFPGLRVTDKKRRELEVLSTVLSGQGGRLFVELRDKRSMAYSVSSFSIEGVDPGYFAVYMGTSPEKVDAALQGIRLELEKLCERPVTSAELHRAKEHLIGTHEIGLQRNGARAALMALDECYGLGADDFLAYADELAHVTEPSVQALARELLSVDKSALALVGP